MQRNHQCWSIYCPWEVAHCIPLFVISVCFNKTETRIDTISLRVSVQFCWVLNAFNQSKSENASLAFLKKVVCLNFVAKWLMTSCYRTANFSTNYKGFVSSWNREVAPANVGLYFWISLTKKTKLKEEEKKSPDLGSWFRAADIS